MQRKTLPPISEQELARHLPRTRLSLFAQFLMIGVAVLLLSLAAYFTWYFYEMRAFNEAVAELRASGFATTPAEILADYVVKEPNPGPLWLAAAESLKASGGTQVLPFFNDQIPEPPLPGQPWEQLDEIRAYLNRHAEMLETVNRAANSKHPARYERWLQQADGVRKTGSVSGHLALSKVLSLSAYVSAHDGDIPATTRALRNGLCVSLSLADEPSLLSQFVSAACLEISAETTERLMQLDFNDEQLSELQQTVRKIDPRRSMTLGMESETVSAIIYLGKPMGVGRTNHDDSADFIRQMATLLKASKSEEWSEIRSIADQAESQRGDNQVNRNGTKPFHNRMVGMKSFVIKQMTVQARLSVLDALISAKRFKRKYGVLPNSLEVMVPEFLPAVPVDPFSKQQEPLCFLSVGPVFRIYSRGFDAQDDGGDRSLQSHSEASGSTNHLTDHPTDIVAELRR